MKNRDIVAPVFTQSNDGVCCALQWRRAANVQVEYRDAFEPYVVVPTDSEPRFDERLLERMADKALYCRSLHAAG